MKAVIAYASWFGHNQAIAKALARELSSHGVAVTCAPVSAIKVDDLADLDLLVLGTYTHAGHANGRLIRLCDAIPRRRLEHMAVAIFGAQRAEDLRIDEPGGVDDLVRHLEARGFEIAVPPLRIGLQGAAALLPGYTIEGEDYLLVKKFARDLLEACVPAPFV
jgi:menaquinone-dependent protoporphyrinogen IX oxidase